MHILFLSHYYPPEVNAPASRTSECAKLWVAMGHKVTIVTAAPSHPRGIVYPGYRNSWLTRETVDGVNLIRIWTFLAANEGFGRRILNFLSYPLSVLLHLRSMPRADVVVSSSPQFFAGLAGWLLKRRRQPWVFEVRDLYPDTILAVGAMKRSLAIRLLERLERAAYRHADAIVSVTDSFVPHLRERGAAGPIEVIKNGVDLDFYAENPNGEAGAALRRELGLEGRFIAAYVGTHGMSQGLGTVLDAAELTKDDPRIVYLLVGDGAERAGLIAARDSRELANVLIVGQRPKADMPAVWQATDASLVLLRRRDTFKTVLPSKMFEAMAMRRPIVLGVEGEARALLDQAAAGIGIVPESAGELAAAVRRLAADPAEARRMGESGRRYVERNFDRARLAERYAAFLLQVSAAKRRAGQ
jgi:glycosyltransferase involved in cell wall biosynthesis